ncbi:MAG: hypothetical protein ACM3SU_03100 [Acidobacteriota bacterium]
MRSRHHAPLAAILLAAVFALGATNRASCCSTMTASGNPATAITPACCGGASVACAMSVDSTPPLAQLSPAPSFALAAPTGQAFAGQVPIPDARPVARPNRAESLRAGFQPPLLI